MLGSARKITSTVPSELLAGVIAQVAYLGGNRLRLEGGTPHHAVVQHLAPAVLRIARAQVGLPRLAHRIVRRRVGIVQHGLDYIVRRFAAVEGVDHGLDHGRRAVIGAGIGPALQVVGAVDMPFRNHRGFIEVGTEVGGYLHLAERLLKMQVHGGVVNRVAIQDQQPLDFARIHVVDQADDVLPLDGRHGIHGLGVDHGFADVAQRLVDGDRGQVHGRSLLLAGNHHALAGIGLQIRRQSREEGACGARRRLGTGATGADGRCERSSKGSHVTGFERQPMFGLEASGAGRALDGVEPVHGGVGIGQLAPAGVVGRQAKESGMGDAGKKVSVEGDDDIRILKSILGVVVIAESSLRSRIGRVAVDWVPLQPLGIGIALLRCLPLRRQGGRGDGVAQDVEPGAAAGLLVRQHGAEDGKESGKLPHFAAADHPLRAVGVVEAEKRTLGQRIGRTAVNRVIRIAVYFDRPVGVALDQQRHRAGIEGHGGRKVHRAAQHQVFRLLHVGIDGLVRLLGTSGEPGESQRSAHHLEKAAARYGVEPLRSLVGKLPLHHIPKRGGIGQLVDAAPVGLPRLAGKLCPGGFERQLLVLSLGLAHR